MMAEQIGMVIASRTFNMLFSRVFGKQPSKGQTLSQFLDILSRQFEEKVRIAIHSEFRERDFSRAKAQCELALKRIAMAVIALEAERERQFETDLNEALRYAEEAHGIFSRNIYPEAIQESRNYAFIHAASELANVVGLAYVGVLQVRASANPKQIPSLKAEIKRYARYTRSLSLRHIWVDFFRHPSHDPMRDMSNYKKHFTYFEKEVPRELRKGFSARGYFFLGPHGGCGMFLPVCSDQFSHTGKYDPGMHHSERANRHLVNIMYGNDANRDTLLNMIYSFVTDYEAYKRTFNNWNPAKGYIGALQMLRNMHVSAVSVEQLSRSGVSTAPPVSFKQAGIRLIDAKEHRAIVEDFLSKRAPNKRYHLQFMKILAATKRAESKQGSAPRSGR